MSDVKKFTYSNDIKIGFIADDIVNLTKFEYFHNATFALMLAAQELNVKVLLAESDSLRIINSKVFANFYDVSLKKDPKKPLIINSKFELPLTNLDILFARKDPPVNENYLSYLQILNLVSGVFIINNPLGILRANEKLYALNFKDLVPPTLVSSTLEQMLDFINEYREVVLKPLFKSAGEGVIRLNKNDKNLRQILKENLSAEGRLLIQKYIPSVINGDKRIILLNGEPIGGILRIPKEGDFRANIHRGAEARPYILSEQDYKICEALQESLVRDGLYFTAIDVIDNYLIELNVTCPAGLQELEKCTKRQAAKEIINWALQQKAVKLKCS